MSPRKVPHHPQVPLTSSLQDLLFVIENYMNISDAECTLDKQSTIPIVKDVETLRVMGCVQVKDCLDYFKRQILHMEKYLAAGPKLTRGESRWP